MAVRVVSAAKRSIAARTCSGCSRWGGVRLARSAQTGHAGMSGVRATVGLRRDLVALAPDRRDRRRDQREPSPELGIVHVGVAGVHRERRGVRGLDVARRRRKLGRVGAAAGSWNTSDQLLGGQREEVGQLDPVDVDPDRVQQHRAGDPLVLADRELRRDPAADR